MIFKAIVEYEYPTEHKPPIKAEIVLHGDRVVANIKPFEQKMGRWIKHIQWEISMYECSECGTWTDDDSGFCPNCGAKMSESEVQE